MFEVSIHIEAQTQQSLGGCGAGQGKGCGLMWDWTSQTAAAPPTTNEIFPFNFTQPLSTHDTHTGTQKQTTGPTRQNQDMTSYTGREAK